MKIKNPDYLKPLTQAEIEQIMPFDPELLERVKHAIRTGEGCTIYTEKDFKK